MESFCVRNNTSGSSFKSIISGATSRKEASDLTGFRISLMIVAVDRQKLAWLLDENYSASIICVSFSSSSPTQDSFISKYFFVMDGDNSGKRRIMKRPR